MVRRLNRDQIARIVNNDQEAIRTFESLFRATEPLENDTFNGTVVGKLIGEAELTPPLAVISGGTGSGVAATGLANLGGAPLASPAFTGTPTAPTPAVGDNSTRIATTAWAASRRFVSAGQTITAAGLITVAHGLGARPAFISAHIECTTADAGYSIGDIVDVALVNNSDAATSRANGVYADATNINVRITNATNAFLIGNKSTGASAAITNTSWQLFIRAGL
jgi:hypothetical protein